jgi:hypothetical protein
MKHLRIFLNVLLVSSKKNKIVQNNFGFLFSVLLCSNRIQIVITENEKIYVQKIIMCDTVKRKLSFSKKRKLFENRLDFNFFFYFLSLV